MFFKKKKLKKIRIDIKLYNCHDIFNIILLCYTLFVANLGEKTRVARCSITAAISHGITRWLVVFDTSSGVFSSHVSTKTHNTIKSGIKNNILRKVLW